MRLNIHIGEIIRQQLKERDRSIRWLAKKVNCDQSSLSKKLHDQYMNSDMIERISDVLDVNVFRILADALDENKILKTNTLQTKEKDEEKYASF